MLPERTSSLQLNLYRMVAKAAKCAGVLSMADTQVGSWRHSVGTWLARRAGAKLPPRIAMRVLQGGTSGPTSRLLEAPTFIAFDWRVLSTLGPQRGGAVPTREYHAVSPANRLAILWSVTSWEQPSLVLPRRPLLNFVGLLWPTGEKEKGGKSHSPSGASLFEKTCSPPIFSSKRLSTFAGREQVDLKYGSEPRANCRFPSFWTESHYSNFLAKETD